MNPVTSFWEQETFCRPYDLIIIGAGITGLSAALFFKKEHPKARVAVFEKGFIPEGASTRNAGFACIGSITEHLADLEKESEEKVKKRIYRRYKGLSLLKETIGLEAMQYEQCGGYELFANKENFEKAASEIGRFNDWVEELTGKKSVYEKGTFEGYPVIFNRLEGALHPGKMMRELIRLVAEAGVEIKWNSPVKEAGEGGEVILENGMKLQSKKMLFAANGFVRHLLSDIQIKPARGLVFVTNQQANLPWKGIFHHDRGYIYFRNVGNRLLIGGARNIDAEREETDSFGVNKKIENRLRTFVNEIIKLPEGWKIDQKWSGIMGFTPKKTPIVKQLDKRRFIAAGLSGMGIAIGMEIGRKASELMGR